MNVIRFAKNVAQFCYTLMNAAEFLSSLKCMKWRFLQGGIHYKIKKSNVTQNFLFLNKRNKYCLTNVFMLKNCVEV